LLSRTQVNFKDKPYNVTADEGPSLGRAARVGSDSANAWGVHDIHGNTFQWCRDWYQARLPGGVDPELHGAHSTARLNGTGDASRVRRGGEWTDDGRPGRSAFRRRFQRERCYDNSGFRGVAVRR
jgi:formylglycine-generating enzyme required for sulfatase activity